MPQTAKKGRSEWGVHCCQLTVHWTGDMSRADEHRHLETHRAVESHLRIHYVYYESVFSGITAGATFLEGALGVLLQSPGLLFIAQLSLHTQFFCRR